MEKYKSEIIGHLDIFVGENEDQGEKWKEIFIHGDPDGLRSLGRLLIKLADTNQDNIAGLPMAQGNTYILDQNLTWRTVQKLQLLEGLTLKELVSFTTDIKKMNPRKIE